MNLNQRFKIYSKLLYLYPVAYRTIYSEQMLQTLSDMLDGAPTKSGRIRIWLRVTVDLPLSAAKERFNRGNKVMNVTLSHYMNLDKSMGLLKFSFAALAGASAGMIPCLVLLAYAFMTGNAVVDDNPLPLYGGSAVLSTVLAVLAVGIVLRATHDRHVGTSMRMLAFSMPIVGTITTIAAVSAAALGRFQTNPFVFITTSLVAIAAFLVACIAVRFITVRRLTSSEK